MERKNNSNKVASIGYKTCPKCKTKLSTDAFYKDKRSKDGLYSSCKKCWAIYSKKYYKEYFKDDTHLEKRRDQSRKQYKKQGREYRRQIEKRYRENNIETCRQRERDYYTNHKEYRKQHDAEYYRRNKKTIARQMKEYYEENKTELLKYHQARYRSYYETHKDEFYFRSQQRLQHIKQATPLWFEKDEIIAMYRTRRKIEEQTNISHHVDHIVPLRGKRVCGLHCLTNLRIITAKENKSKGNKLIESLFLPSRS